MKKKRFVLICILCMLFVALSFDIAIRKVSYAREEIKIETNLNTETEKTLDNLKKLNDGSFKLKEETNVDYNDTINDYTKPNISIIIQKLLISSTFILKAVFLYFDICLKDKNKSKHDDCTYKVISNAYGIKEIKKD